MSDAGFFDAGPGPLALRAEAADDLPVIAALVQDAVLPVTEIHYTPRKRQFALLLNRFRWEDAGDARAENRDFERVQSVLLISDVTRVQSEGIDRKAADLVLSLLTIGWQGNEDGSGRLMLEFAGDGTIAADVECIAMDLRDVTRPYVAPSGKAPHHPE